MIKYTPSKYVEEMSKEMFFADCHTKLRLSKLWQRQGAAIILRVLRESSSDTSDLGAEQRGFDVLISLFWLKTIYGVE